jgi:glycine/D-amino acid oxidase-like deaminating enzyme
VIGAGAFGGWTALHLLERGARVTLLDAWGAGHPRGTSSDESRLIRCGYGQKPIYTAWTWRALKLWRYWQRRWRLELFEPCGVLWLCAREDDYVRASLAALREHKIPNERMSPRQLARRYPQINVQGIRVAYFEPRAGVLRARLATQTVTRAVADSGGRVLLASVLSPEGRSNIFQHLPLSDGTKVHGTHFVFCCGPWLPQLFPSLLGTRIRVTKQEVFYFGTPPGDGRFRSTALPGWIEVHSDFYGIPALDDRGFKIALDRSGPLFDPTTGDREPDLANLDTVRRHLALRFPALADAPLAEARVCQYERTPDSHLVIDRHPDCDNVWLVGGGSGHGFKLGPAVGEFVAQQVLRPGRAPIAPEMRLFASAWPTVGPAPVTRSF